MASIRPRRFFRLPERPVSHIDSTSNSNTPSSNGDALPTTTATGGNNSNNNNTNSYYHTSFSNGGYPSVPLTHPAIFFINDTSTPGHDPEVYAKKTSATVAVGDGTRRRSGRAKPSGGVGVPAAGFYMEDSGENGESGSATGGVGGTDNGGAGTTGGRAERGGKKLKRFVGPRTFAVLASEAAVAAAAAAANNNTAATGSSSASSSSSSTSSFAPTKSAPSYVPREPKAATTKKPAARSRAFKAPFARLSETPLPKAGSQSSTLPPVHSSPGSTSTILAPTVTSLFVGGVDLGCIPPFEGELPAGTWSTKDSFARRSDKERKARVKIAVQKRMEQMGLPASLIPGAQAQAIKGMLSEEGTRRPGNVVSLIKPGFAHVATGPGGKGGDPNVVLVGSPGEIKLTAGQKAKRKEEELSIANEAAELAKLKPATATAPVADVAEKDEKPVIHSMGPTLDSQRPTKKSKLSPPLLSNPVSAQTDSTVAPFQGSSSLTQPVPTSSQQQSSLPPPSPPRQLLPPTFSVNDALSSQPDPSFRPLHRSPPPSHPTSLNLASGSVPASNLSLILNPTESVVADQAVAVKKKGPSIRLKLGGLGPSTERASSVPIGSVAKSIPSTFSVASAPSSSSTPSSSAPSSSSSSSSSLSPPSSSAPLPAHNQHQTSLASVIPSNFNPILVSIPSSSFLPRISTASTATLGVNPNTTLDPAGYVGDSSMSEDGSKNKRKGRGKAKPKTESQLGASTEKEGKTGKNGGKAMAEIDGKKAGFKMITKNTYPNRAKDLAQPSECECRPPPGWKPEDRDQGSLIDACGEHCVNRAMQYLCHPKNCRFGEVCLNKSLYKRTGPSIKVFSTSDRGFTVKAMEFIPANSFVIDYRGEVVSTTEYYDRLGSIYGDRKEFYAVDYGDGEVLDSGLKGNIARFINHGCDPNLRVEKWMTLGEGFEEYEVGFWTTRDIKAGEELFYDYNFDSFSTKIKSTAAAQTGTESTPTSGSTTLIVPGRQRCLCGAAYCTGWVGGAKQAAKELANVKRGEIDDDVIDLISSGDNLTRHPSHCLSKAGLVATRWAQHRQLNSSSLNQQTEIVQNQKARQELKDVTRIDQLLDQVGRDQTISSDRQGIAMRPSGQLWQGVRNIEPWSFTYYPGMDSQDKKGVKSRGTEEAKPAVRSDEKEEELPPRRMSDSYVEINLPLASDPTLLNDYISTSGGLRIGKLTEHIDSLAGAIAYKHLYVPAKSQDDGSVGTDGEAKSSVYMATASADRLDLFKDLLVQDLRLSGQVCFVGSSSMEVFVRMEGLRGPDEKSETLMLGRFTMVARDTRFHTARRINSLLIETPEEKELFQVGKEHKRRKQASSKTSLSKVPPTSEEMAILHQFILNHQSIDAAKSEGKRIVKMEDTLTSADHLMHPQQRNMHSKIFGGYLMRLAYELSYSNVVLFTRSPMKFLALDEISFKLPVPIGSVLRLTAVVTHTDSSTNQVHSQVTADVVDVSTGRRNTTNDFHFTWQKEDNGAGLDVEVIPNTYAESMSWLEARRRLAVGNKMRGLYVQST
ncbi:Acyl-CoA thioesterase [Phaffia rhodozyma]|uniref:Acyl-CoA thioesterase n=1 Tax=Phaffia rhodozyma TaxID=264483 RepID=A0A0F7SQN4_PHARH|nr:Acyl-CoA thioesterase [Phaffia rhodozyma]